MALSAIGTSEVSLLVRVIALLVAAVLAVIAVQTERGQGIWTLIKEAEPKSAELCGLRIRKRPNYASGASNRIGVFFDLVGTGLIIELDSQLHHRIA